jgi:hypothetical protein
MHECRYAEPAVATLLGTVQAWNRETRPLVYPLKNFVRFGVHGALGPVNATLRSALEHFRCEQAAALGLLAAGSTSQATQTISAAEVALAVTVLELFHGTDLSSYHPALSSVAHEAQRVATSARQQ